MTYSFARQAYRKALSLTMLALAAATGAELHAPEPGEGA